MSKRVKGKQWIGFYFPKIFVLSAAFTPVVLHFVHQCTVIVRRLWFILESRSNDFRSPAVRADFCCLIDREIILRAEEFAHSPYL